ncbi:glycosyltransferase 87 family protein [Corynebacterium pseudodiphtheriticum]|uniref:glycosyltransferase 87 family protein n=1 Tax=Corynebacterium pseudodiphtheriticum TaxID=37637 RepID=UPI0025519449|nr:glycosyltransferase 87 family protein [Corynebacterium pseudodiphtheriticum]MDK8685845.1 glycosyltransferase 87 family protein [Corynebacterium pseudodiphtheriticum]
MRHHSAPLLTIIGLIAGLAATFYRINKTASPVDMVIYRQGVDAFLHGREMYSEPMFAGDLALPFIYPPFGALFMAPLNIVPGIDDTFAGRIVIALSNALLLLCLWLVWRWLLDANRWAMPAAAISWALALISEPVELNHSFAQINVILMSLVVLDLVPRKRTLPQGWLIGIAAAIKLTPLAMLLYFLLRKDFRAIVTAGISAALATLLAAIVRFDATREFYGARLLGMGSGGDFGVNTSYQSNSSWRGMIQRWFSSEQALEDSGNLVTALWAVLVILTIATGAWIMIQLLRRGYLVDAWLINAIIMLLISPVSWSHHWVWLALAVPVWFWRAHSMRDYGLGAVVALWISVLVVLEQPPKWWYGDAIEVHALSFWPKVFVSDFVWLGLATLLVIAWECRPQGKYHRYGKSLAGLPSQTGASDKITL